MGYSVTIDIRLLQTSFPHAQPGETIEKTSVSPSSLETLPQLITDSTSPYCVYTEDCQSAIRAIFQCIGAMRGPQQFILTDQESSAGKPQTRIVDLSGKTRLRRHKSCLVYTPQLDYGDCISRLDEGHTILTVVPPSVEKAIAVDQTFPPLKTKGLRAPLLKLYRALQATLPRQEIWEKISVGNRTPIAPHYVMTQYGLTQCRVPACHGKAIEARQLLNACVTHHIQAIDTYCGERTRASYPPDTARSVTSFFNCLQRQLSVLFENDRDAQLRFIPFQPLIAI